LLGIGKNNNNDIPEGFIWKSIDSQKKSSPNVSPKNNNITSPRSPNGLNFKIQMSATKHEIADGIIVSTKLRDTYNHKVAAKPKRH